MIFNQLFDEKSSTYTYIISSGKGREALIIDPVIFNKIFKLNDFPFIITLKIIWNIRAKNLITLDDF